MSSVPLVQLAVIDVGSNSVRLEVASWMGGSLSALHRDRVVTRLGAADGTLHPSAIMASVLAIASMLEEASRYDVQRVRIVATAAVREASNASDLIDAVREVTGEEVAVLSERAEAESVLRSVLDGPGSNASSIVAIDIGGGSSEVIVARDGDIVHLASMPLGAVNLAARYEQSDVIDPSMHAFMRSEIESEMVDWIPSSDIVLDEGFVTGGTFTTIARVLLGAEASIEGAVLTIEQVAELSGNLASVDAAGRSEIKGISLQRAGIIVAGATLAEMAMRALGLSRVHVHEGGVGRGILLDMASA